MSAITTSRYAIFNGYNLNNVPGLSVYAIDLPGQQNKTLNIYPLAKADARKVSSAIYQSNQVNIAVYITAASRDLLEQALDTLYANLQNIESTLLVPKSGTTRQYTATYQSSSLNNPIQGTNSASSNYVDMVLTFQCSDSYGYDVGPTLIANLLAQTTAQINMAYTQGGNAEWQVPRILVNIKALTGGTAASIILGNNNTGQAVTINRTWSQFDQLIVDCKAHTVQVNAVDVVFTGAFPEVQIGPQTLTYNDTFASRTVEVYANVINRWH